MLKKKDWFGFGSWHTYWGEALVCQSNSRRPNELFEPLRTCTWIYMLHINTHGLTKMYINKNKLPNFILKWLFHFAYPSAMSKSLSLDILINIFSFPISDFPYSLQIHLIIFQKKMVFFFLKMLFKLIFTGDTSKNETVLSESHLVKHWV